MHPRSPYKNPPDFAILAESYPPLTTHLISTSQGKSMIDFHDEASQRCLTQAFLYRDFSLNLDLPRDRLCPPVPNRLNYVLWIQDIVSATCPLAFPVTGIDIGTGASAIYPLLACRLEPSWTFVATEVDTISMEFARSNVLRNGLDKRIHVASAAADGPLLLPLSQDASRTFTFSMSNPPFYSSKADIEWSAKGKEGRPNAICTGADVEIITPGGESTFVGRMVAESLIHRSQCRWYTSMLGKLSSLTEIVALLRHHSIDNYGITEFIQGETRRWAVAWSFTDDRLPDKTARTPSRGAKPLMPPRNSAKTVFMACTGTARGRLCQALRTVLVSIEGLEVVDMGSAKWEEEEGDAVVVSACGNTWSRAARRARGGAPLLSQGSGSVALVCRLWCGEGDGREGPCLRGEWRKGRDRALFEGFWSHVVRKVGAVLEGDDG